MKYQPRIPNITAVIGYDSLPRREKGLKESLERLNNEPERQGNFSELASDYRLVAMDQWVLGYPFDSVLDLLKKSSGAQLSVLRLRGTVTHIQTHSYRNGPPVTITKVNYYTGSSWDAFQWACNALAVAEPSVATAIAEKIWDPPDADYIYRSGEMMRREHQKVAYAFRDVYLGRPIEALNDVRRISTLWRTKSFPRHVAYSAGIVLALASSDKSLATDSLTSFIRWYTRETPYDLERSQYKYLHLPALGLAALLISRGLTSPHQLPLDPVRFPRDFLDPAVAALPHP